MTSVCQLAHGEDTDALGQGMGACAGVDDAPVVEAQVIQRDAQYRTTWIATR